VIERPVSQAPPPNEAPRRRRRRPSAPRHRRYLLAGGGIALLALIVVATILAVSRYLPALDEARTLRTDLVAMVSRAQAAGLEIDRPALDGLGRDLAAARGRLSRLADLLANDPLVGLARALPPTGADVAPERSRVVSVSGGSFARLTAPAVVAEEVGRTVIGTYLGCRPGERACATSGSARTPPTPTRPAVSTA